MESSRPTESWRVGIWEFAALWQPATQCSTFQRPCTLASPTRLRPPHLRKNSSGPATRVKAEPTVKLSGLPLRSHRSTSFHLSPALYPPWVDKCPRFPSSCPVFTRGLFVHYQRLLTRVLNCTPPKMASTSLSVWKPDFRVRSHRPIHYLG